MKASAGLLAATTVVVVIAATLRAIEATVETTCKAAAGSDRRINYQFCTSQLGRYRGSSDADTWGLAKIAALVGVNNADLVVDDTKGLEAKPSIEAKTRASLAQCSKLYNSVGFVFANAHDELNKRNYAAGKQKLQEATLLALQCEGNFARAGVASPLVHRSANTVQLAVLATAITNLIHC